MGGLLTAFVGSHMSVSIKLILLKVICKKNNKYMENLIMMTGTKTQLSHARLNARKQFLTAIKNDS